MSRLVKTIVGLIVTIVIFWMIVGVASWFGVGDVPDGTVVRLEFDGTISEQLKPQVAAMFGGEVSPALPTIAHAIRRAADDPKVVGLLLDIKQPEVAMAQVQEIEAAMAVFRASGKWNAAFMRSAGEMGGGSSAYALAVTADTVVLSPPGTIGLSSVRAEAPFVKDLLDRLHIQAHVEKRKAYKTAGNMFTHTGFTAEHKESLAAVLGDVQRQLSAHLAARRKVPAERVRKWFEMTTFGADEAQEQGLIDEVLYWDGVIDLIKPLPGRDLEHKDEDEDELLSMGRYIESDDKPSGAVLAFLVVDGSIAQSFPTDRAQMAFGQAGATADQICEALRDARKAKVKGVLLRINSPGGSYVASDLIRREVAITRMRGIPVVASMGGLAASGGYFVAMDANHIVAEPATITGSIGVLTGLLPLRKAMHDWLGVTWDTYDTVPTSAAISWLDPPNARQGQLISSTLDRIYTDFVTKAAEGRKKTYAAIDAVAQGRIWSGEAAVQAGLVDELGGVHEATRKLRELAGLTADEPVELRHFPHPKNLLQVLQQLLPIQTTGGVEAPAALGVLGALGAEQMRALQQLWMAARDPTDAVLFTPLQVRF